MKKILIYIFITTIFGVLWFYFVFKGKPVHALISGMISFSSFVFGLIFYFNNRE